MVPHIKGRNPGCAELIVQELCESRGGRPGLSVLTSLLVSVDVKIYCTVLRHWSQLVPNMTLSINSSCAELSSVQLSSLRGDFFRRWESGNPICAPPCLSGVSLDSGMGMTMHPH